MNKTESKYFSTAARMDEAFLALLEKKDLPYITVKEICQQAGVNRSTFYLHYETIGDLLAESVQYMTERFLDHMRQRTEPFAASDTPLSAGRAYFITPEYLEPYLSYIAQNKRLFRTAMEQSAVLRLDRVYQRMFRHVFSPILEQFQVPEENRAYLMAFYIHGLMAIVDQWLQNDCADSIQKISAIMRQCVARPDIALCEGSLPPHRR